MIVNQKSDFKSWPRDCRRVYLGNDHCPHLLPPLAELDELADLAKAKKLKITLLTPWSGEKTIEHIKKMIDRLAQRGDLRELVANDLGVLNWAAQRYPDCEFVLGRALFALAHQKTAIKRYKIKRTEVDPLSLVDPRGLKVSVYRFGYLTVSRYCPFARIAQNRKKNHGIVTCARECRKFGPMKIKSNLLEKTLILKDNSLRVTDKNFKACRGADRVILGR